MTTGDETVPRGERIRPVASIGTLSGDGGDHPIEVPDGLDQEEGVPDRSWREGATIGRYRLEALIGEGGFGQVWRASDTVHPSRKVAIKVLMPPRHQLPKDPGERALALQEHHERFLREAEKTSELSNGPHIIAIHDWDHHEGRPYIVMSYFDGRPLSELTGAGPMDPARAVAILAQVAKALHYSHGRGLVHRDLKPSNILVQTVDDEDDVRLVDFGAVGGVTEDVVRRVTRTGYGAPGTAAYMAPERFSWDHRGRPLEPPRPTFDTYALACVLYECLTGQRAFHGLMEPTLLDAHRHPYRPRPSDAEVPDAADLTPFDGVVVRGLAVRVEDRTPDARSFASGMRSALADWEAERDERERERRAAREAEEARRAAETRQAEARRAEETRRAEEARQEETARRAEEERRAEEDRRAEEARRAEERRAEEARRAEEPPRIEEETPARVEEDTPARASVGEWAAAGGAVVGILGGGVSRLVEPGLPGSVGIIAGGWLVGAAACGWWRSRQGPPRSR